MSDNDWNPSGDQLSKGHLLGGLSSSGDLIRPAKENSRNTLQRSDNRAVRKLGDFCQGTPPDMDTGMATFGGLLIGLRIGQRFHGPALDGLLSEIDSMGKTQMGTAFMDKVIDHIMRDEGGDNLLN